MKRTLSIAIMGCVVNGPGETRHADLGITGAGEQGRHFPQGGNCKDGHSDEADEAFALEFASLE